MLNTNTSNSKPLPFVVTWDGQGFSAQIPASSVETFIWPSTGGTTGGIQSVSLAPNSGPYFLTTGPDGAIWFTEYYAGQIGRITTDGQLSVYPIPQVYPTPYDIVSGPDGALWFTATFANQIDRISTDGQLAEFDVPDLPYGLTVGPDGALWFAYSGGIGRLGTDGSLQTDSVWPDTDWITDVTFGPDGNLWMTEGQSCGTCGANKIGRLDGIDGSYSSWVLPTAHAYPYRIMSGPDGALWFTESAADKIGRITTAGQITEYSLPGTLSDPGGITVGADGALWFTADATVGRITTSGQITAYPIPGATRLLGITLGPDKALWLADEDGNRIFRFVPPS